MERTCDNCVYCDVSATEEPCKSCDGPVCRFKPKEEAESMTKECANCMYKVLDVLYEPCLSCKDYSAWEPKGQKEKKMDNENKNTTTKIDTEAELEKMREELKVAQAKIEDMEHKARMHWNEMAMLKGEVAGLKFALRCNGVSGGEVR